MKKSEIFEELNKIFTEIFDDDTIQLKNQTRASDIEGWDSLTHITLISAVEKTFDIKFAMKEVIGMKNVGEMADIIEREAY